VILGNDRSPIKIKEHPKEITAKIVTSGKILSGLSQNFSSFSRYKIPAPVPNTFCGHFRMKREREAVPVTECLVPDPSPGADAMPMAGNSGQKEFIRKGSYPENRDETGKIRVLYH